MFIYLSKKISIPGGAKLNTLSWNHNQGWIACGGEDGLLKVLKLETQSGSDTRARGVAAPSKLSMNHALEGHKHSVVCSTWNHVHRKLTTSDESGKIIVWMLHKESWFEDMINNRGVSVVTDMKWTPDGTKICIIYEDGAVILGSLEGSRLWGNELGMNLSLVEWSPDGRSILFANSESQVFLYGADGNKICELELAVAGGTNGDKMIGMHWYDGTQGYADVGAPTLAIGFESGRVQVTRGVSMDNPMLIDTGLTLSHCQWNSNGTILTLAGAPKRSEDKANGKVYCMVQFYTPYGQHLRSLRVPGEKISSITWEGSGLRVAISVDSFIYFANIRPDYKWGYFSNTLCYSYNIPDRLENMVVFWDLNNDDRSTKYVKQLMGISAAGDNCVLATKVENISPDLTRAQRSVTRSTMLPSKNNHNSNESKHGEGGSNTDDLLSQDSSYLLVLCDAIGSPVDSKYTKVEPLFMTMTSYHVIVANEQIVYIWQYKSPVAKMSSTETGSYGGKNSKNSSTKNAPSLRRKEGRAKMFHVDKDPSKICIPVSGSQNTFSKEQLDLLLLQTDDSITCISANDKCLIVGRESGLIHRYGLPQISLDEQYVVHCRPQQIGINSNTTRLSIIDINATLTFFDMEARTEGPGGETIKGSHLDFEKKDVWDMKWAEDNPKLIAVMEKVKMYVFRDTEPEEPVLSSGYLCQHADLQIKSVLLDEIMQHPHAPVSDDIIDSETKTLRDAREIIDVGIDEAFAYIEARSHPRLWRLLAEAALERLDFSVADKAFVRCADYPGIQFVKSLRVLNDKVKQRAQVAAYFERFDEAETYYRDIDRKDLAIELRKKLGDWFRVVELLQSGQDGGRDDELLREARKKIGDYFTSRQKWTKAVQYYALAKDPAALVQCYYILEEYECLEKLVRVIPARSPLLFEIGQKFHSVGMSEAACNAFIKGGDVKAAVDSCVLLNQWDHAVQLAQEHDFPQIEGLLAKYAYHLLEKGETLQAIQLYRKAKKTTQAAAQLSKLAKEFAKGDLLRAKKLYVLAALEVEEMRTRVLDTQMKTLAGGMTKKTFGMSEDETEVKPKSAMTAAQTTAATLENLLQDDAATGEHRGLDNPWKGAEGIHLLMLAQKQLYSSRLLDSLVTAVKLRDYDDVIEPRDVHSLIAITAFYNQAWGQCSKAFSELESLKTISNQEKETISELAFSIFSKFPPVDPPKIEKLCTKGDGICMASGRPISSKVDNRIYKCRRCSRKMYEEYLRGIQHCPLCHSILI